MVAVPIKPEYGPTLGRLLSPRWRAASALTRGVVLASGAALLALAVALALTLLSPSYSHGGPVAFSFTYRGLYRVTPDPGGYVKVQKRAADGALQNSFAVEPLTLPPYRGGLSGELPLYAASYENGLLRRYADVVLRGDGKTQVNHAPAYEVLYTATVEGRRMYGRDVLLLPERPGVREGVVIVMQTAPGVSRQVAGPAEVAGTGMLQAAFKSFSLG